MSNELLAEAMKLALNGQVGRDKKSVEAAVVRLFNGETNVNALATLLRHTLVPDLSQMVAGRPEYLATLYMGGKYDQKFMQVLHSDGEYLVGAGPYAALKVPTTLSKGHYNAALSPVDEAVFAPKSLLSIFKATSEKGEVITQVSDLDWTCDNCVENGAFIMVEYGEYKYNGRFIWPLLALNTPVKVSFGPPSGGSPHVLLIEVLSGSHKGVTAAIAPILHTEVD